MPKPISAVDTRRRLGALLEDVARNGAEYVVERHGTPIAAIIPIQTYENHLKERSDWFDRVEALRQHLAQKEPVEDLKEAIDEATAIERRRRK